MEGGGHSYVKSYFSPLLTLYETWLQLTLRITQDKFRLSLTPETKSMASSRAQKDLLTLTADCVAKGQKVTQCKAAVITVDLKQNVSFITVWVSHWGKLVSVENFRYQRPRLNGRFLLQARYRTLARLLNVTKYPRRSKLVVCRRMTFCFWNGLNITQSGVNFLITDKLSCR